MYLSFYPYLQVYLRQGEGGGSRPGRKLNSTCVEGGEGGGAAPTQVQGRLLQLSPIGPAPLAT